VVKSAALALAAALALSAQEQPKSSNSSPAGRSALHREQCGNSQRRCGRSGVSANFVPIVANNRIVIPPGSYVTAQ